MPNKPTLYDRFAMTGQALASGRRVELLDLLAQAERSVDELAEAADLSVANASQHLLVLRRVGLVAARREGNRTIYRIASEMVIELLDLLRLAAFDRSAEAREAAEIYLGGEVKGIGRDELARLMDRGEVVVIDVRPFEEFAAGHIAAARSIPVDELAARLDDLPADLEIVAYCRGRFCAFANQAVRTIEAAGMAARRLEDGFPQWRQAGLPVEVAS